MRCPHCAAPNVVPPACRVCGLSPEVPAAQESLGDLEPTGHRRVVAVQVERLPGLETTEEVLGDTRIPEVPEVSSRCYYCGKDMGTGVFCEHCGRAGRRPSRGRTAVLQERRDDVRHCVQCGVANPISRAVCVACGNKL